MDYKEIYNQWLENPYFDEATKEELKAEIETQKAMFYLQQQDKRSKQRINCKKLELHLCVPWARSSRCKTRIQKIDLRMKSVLQL